MDAYDYLKDIFIPGLAPIIAALAIALVVRQEAGKLRLRGAMRLESDVGSVYRDVNYLIEAYQLMGLKVGSGQGDLTIEITELKRAFDQMWSKLMANPDVYKKYFLNAVPAGSRNPILLMLYELRCRFDRIIPPTFKLDTFVLYCLHKLSWLYESDELRLGETREVLEEIAKADPKFYEPWEKIGRAS